MESGQAIEELKRIKCRLWEHEKTLDMAIFAIDAIEKIRARLAEHKYILLDKRLIEELIEGSEE